MIKTGGTFKNNIPTTTNGQTGLMLMFVACGEDVEVYKRLNLVFLGPKLPYWVKFILEPMTNKGIDLINSNISYLSPYLSTPLRKFSKKELKQLSGWDIRLVNMYFARIVNGIRFFELNTAGLSTSSIKRIFNFLISELANSEYDLTYLIIEPNNSYRDGTLLFIDEKNIGEVFSKYYEYDWISTN